MFYCKRIHIAARHPILMNVFLLDAGHGDQIPCESKEEEDGFNEGEHDSFCRPMPHVWITYLPECSNYSFCS